MPICMHAHGANKNQMKLAGRRTKWSSGGTQLGMHICPWTHVHTPGSPDRSLVLAGLPKDRSIGTSQTLPKPAKLVRDV